MRLTVLCCSLLAAAACSKADTETEKPEPEPTAETAAEAEAETAAEAPPPGVTKMKLAEGALDMAPDFTLPDADGNEVTLSELRGKTVVLEWFNPGCPFVKYAHGEGPLADMAARHTEDGIVWLAINSGAPGKQGHGVDVNKSAAKKWGMSHPILFDEDGEVGKLYGAKTTPHMYVIDPNGKLAYRGALDNAPLGRVDGDEQVNYVDAALAALADGKAPEVTESKSYGCSVKYAD